MKKEKNIIYSFSLTEGNVETGVIINAYRSPNVFASLISLIYLRRFSTESTNTFELGRPCA